MDVKVISIKALTGGQSSVVAISAASAQSAALTMNSTDQTDVLVTPTVDCFMRQGSAPVAVSDGTDQILLAGNTYRVSGIVNGNKLAFITTGAAGSVYISPGA